MDTKRERKTQVNIKVEENVLELVATLHVDISKDVDRKYMKMEKKKNPL